MSKSRISGRLKLGAAATLFVAAGAFALSVVPTGQADATATAAPSPATPVSVATVASRDIAAWDEFSGRLEAIERVEVRSRVAGAVETIHFREGALVAKGALLVSIDRAPYAAEVARMEAQLAAARARTALAKSDLERGRKMTALETISQRDLDTRINGLAESEANVKAAEAALQTARLSLGYTEIRAPVAGRVGRIDVTVGNLIAAGPGSPKLTTLLSVDPIYASFDADEDAVTRALDTLPAGGDRRADVGGIPVEMGSGPAAVRGRLQLVDNAVDAATGTVRVRAVFDNADGRLTPGQFARLKLGRAKPEPELVVSERAVGVDQDKKFVFVVDADSKAAYREVKLGAPADGLRVVTSGLKEGERIVVNGLHRIRPGALVAPQPVAMDAAVTAQLGAGEGQAAN